MGFFSNAIDFTTKVAVRSGEILIEEELKKQFKKTIIIAIANFCVLCLGLFLVVIEPFDKHISLVVAAILFWGVLISSITRGVIFLVTYRRLVQLVWSKRSVRKGIAAYAKEQYPALAKAEAAVKLGSRFIKKLQDVPTMEDVVDRYISFFFKRIVLFVAFFTAYILTMSFVVKPFVFNSFTGVSVRELYFYPFMMLFGK